MANNLVVNRDSSCMDDLPWDDDLVARAVLKGYWQRTVRYADKLLSTMPRRATDEEDIAMVAISDLVAYLRVCRITPADSDAVWKLLATFTHRRAIEHKRSHFSLKRGGGTVRGESAFCSPLDGHDQSYGINHVLDGHGEADAGDDPRPRVPFVSERLDATLNAIAQLKVDGFTNDEIGEKLQCSVRTIERRLEQIREKLSAGRA